MYLDMIWKMQMNLMFQNQMNKNNTLLLLLNAIEMNSTRKNVNTGRILPGFGRK